jgi:hypothetical protein
MLIEVSKNIFVNPDAIDAVQAYEVGPGKQPWVRILCRGGKEIEIQMTIQDFEKSINMASYL